MIRNRPWEWDGREERTETGKQRHDTIHLFLYIRSSASPCIVFFLLFWGSIPEIRV